MADTTRQAAMPDDLLMKPSLLVTDNSWFIRYKFYHIPFWFAYHYLWWTLRLGSPVAVATAIVSSPAATWKFAFYLVFQALGVYLNLYFLMPRFLERGRYATYVSLLLLTIVTTAVFVVAGYYVAALVSDKTFEELYGRSPYDYYSLFESGALPSTAASMTLAMTIKLTKRWIAGKRREQLLEQEKLETELKFLKSQFNPHFLFNTINSIFVLINKDPRRASESLAKFSDLLRYQLYECNEHHITLSQELSYLENFVALQRLRQDENIEVLFASATASYETLMIAPFILMPFVENAFKHVSRHKHLPNRISIDLSVNGHDLCLKVANTTTDSSARDIGTTGGIGLNNVRRRLSLLYPDAHRLSIDAGKDRFCIQLEISLKSDLALQSKRLVPELYERE